MGGGDAVSSPQSTGSLRGGLTIVFDTPPVIGKVIY
jgi:hypothetical protein